MDVDPIGESDGFISLENSWLEPGPRSIDEACIAVADEPCGREAGMIGRNKDSYTEFIG